MKYEVQITRISYSTESFFVDAESEEEARGKGLEKAYDTVFYEDTAEYEEGMCRETNEE